MYLWRKNLEIKLRFGDMTNLSDSNYSEHIITTYS